MQIDKAAFVSWLQSRKGLTERSAKDVASRMNRVQKMLHIDSISEKTVPDLLVCPEFSGLSLYICAQLKRAVALALEYHANP